MPLAVSNGFGRARPVLAPSKVKAEFVIPRGTRVQPPGEYPPLRGQIKANQGKSSQIKVNQGKTGEGVRANL